MDESNKTSHGYYRVKIKVPKSSLPLFQRLYPIITAKNGEVIFDGKELFNERYEIVENKAWEKMTATEIAAPYIDRAADMGEKTE